MSQAMHAYYGMTPALGTLGVSFGKKDNVSKEKKVLNLNTYIQDHPDIKFAYDFDANHIHSPSGKRNWAQKLLIFPNRIYQALTRHNPVYQWFKKKLSGFASDSDEKKGFLARHMQKANERADRLIAKMFPGLADIIKYGSGCKYARAGHPSCSEGMIILIDHYGDKKPLGAFKGAIKGFQRLWRCDLKRAFELKETGNIEEPLYVYA